MAEIRVATSQEDYKLVAAAVQELNNIPHVKYMSRSAIAELTKLSDSKVRAVLQDMIVAGLLVQYAATNNPKRQRYYYVLTPSGKQLLPA